MLPLLEVREDPVKGRGLYATEAIEADTVVLRDEPIAVASMDAPQMTCVVCKRFVGSIQLHLHVLAEHIKLDAHANSPTDLIELPSMDTEPSLPDLPSPVAPAFVTKHPSAGTTSVVCSQACSDVLHVQTHPIYTPSFLESLAASPDLGVESDHILLVATIMAAVVHRLSTQSTLNWDDAVRDIVNLCVAPDTQPHALKSKQVAHDAAYRHVLASFTPDSSESPPPPPVAYFLQHMTLHVFQRFLSIVQANAVGVQVPSPISRYFAACDENPSTRNTLIAQASTLVEAALQVLCEDGDGSADSDDDSGDDSDDDSGDDDRGDDDSGDDEGGDEQAADDSSDDEGETIQFEWPRPTPDAGDADPLCFSSSALPDLGGLALFPRFSMLNHSCDPSCALAYTGDTAQISVLALRPLGPGDELTISYIDQAAPFQTRQDQLKSRYGFTCTCSECRKHSKKAGKKKRQRVA